MKKKCNICKEEKDTSEFGWAIKSKGVLRGRCKSCFKITQKNSVSTEAPEEMRKRLEKHECKTCGTKELDKFQCMDVNKQFYRKECQNCRNQKSKDHQEENIHERLVQISVLQKQDEFVYCKECKKEKPPRDFDIRKDYINVSFRNVCRSCYNANQRRK